LGAESEDEGSDEDEERGDRRKEEKEEEEGEEKGGKEGERADEGKVEAVEEEKVDSLLRTLPLVHPTHFAVLNAVEVGGREGGKEGGREGTTGFGSTRGGKGWKENVSFASCPCPSALPSPSCIRAPPTV
jgi:hypothetical protein